MKTLELTDTEAKALRELLLLGGRAAKEKRDFYLYHYATAILGKLRRRDERMIIKRMKEVM